MECKITNKLMFFIVVGWLGAIILISLLFNTTGIKEGFFPSAVAAEYEDDGVEDAVPSSLSSALLNDNHAGAGCCNSKQSSSTGCLCLDKDQLDQIRSRGGNKT